jgi:hypothetical protein
MRSILMMGVVVALGGATLASAQLLPPPPIPPPPLPSLVPIPVVLTVSGNEAQGSFELPGGFAADLTIAFENSVGLVPAALDVTVAVVNPLDPLLLGRLPGPGLAIPVGFPVLLRISPSSASALSFSGAYTISLHTHNLQLLATLPLSLFKAPDGGPFRDITKWEGRGSYRDDGSGGDFSEFLIAVDLRPIDGVIVGKFDDLQATLNDNAASMAPAAVAALQASLTQARTYYQAGDLRRAIDEMRDFSRYVKRHGGEEIPDVWRANCSPIVNVAGLLRSGADTLKFSLDRKSSH